MVSFRDYNLVPETISALEKMQFFESTPIQEQVISIIQGNHDLIALAQTGSGKTAACMIPICDRVDITRKEVQVLVVVPTRELALQYASVAQNIGADRPVSAFAVYGGADGSLQCAKLEHGVQILVATPGRLIDFIYNRDIDLSHVDTLVLDEADEMLGIGFLEDLEFIIQCLVHEHQTLLFSATMQDEVRKIAKQYMKSPREISLVSKDQAPAKIDHHFVYCNFKDKELRLLDLLREKNPKRSIIFCKSRVDCEKLCRFLQKNSVRDVEYIHAGLSQDIRTSITYKFQRQKINHLIGTDVLARGMDFSGVTHVIIYQLSDNADIYVHRSGRTGRYDNQGVTLSMVTDRDFGTLTRILQMIKTEPVWEGEIPKRFGGTQSKPLGKAQETNKKPREAAVKQSRTPTRGPKEVSRPKVEAKAPKAVEEAPVKSFKLIPPPPFKPLPGQVMDK